MFQCRHVFIILLLISSIHATAQEVVPQQYRSHITTGNALIVSTEIGQYHFTPYTDHILKVTFLPDSVKRFATSHAVVLPPRKVDFDVTQNNTSVSLHAAGYLVTIRKYPLEITIMESGKPVLRGQHVFYTDTTCGFRFDYPGNEVLMGGGERALPMDRRGHAFDLYNKPQYGYQNGAENLNFGVPYVLSSRMYSMLFDNPQKGYMDFGKKSPAHWETGFIGGELTYYLITGTSHADIIRRYTDLTGHQPMPPRWALGNFVSRMTYFTEQEAREVVDQMQSGNFPMDAIILDLHWFGRYLYEDGDAMMGNLDWDRKYWPNPEQMIADFKEKNIRTILITEPFFLETSQHFETLRSRGLLGTDKQGNPFYIRDFWFGVAGLIDVFKPEARDWFWAQYKKQVERGISGWWCDLGEPEKHPSDMYHVYGNADAVNNIYGHYWSKLIYDGYRQDYPEQRLFNLTRSGFAGSQRYAIFPWSGDVARSWEGLQAQPAIMLSMVMSGLGYMSSDLGGFAGGDGDRNLYTRWLQFGTFNPVFRPHGDAQTVPSEPIYWDPLTRRRARKAIQLRYRLLPYNYTLAWENHATGTPLVRPIWYAYGQNTALYPISDTYFWGPNMLVAPVLKPNQSKRAIYLPSGGWYDFYNDTPYQGDQSYDIPLSMEHIPVFVKAGSFIPMTLDSISNTTSYSSARLQMHYYPNPLHTHSTEFQLYDDDGETYGAYQKGQFALLTFKAMEAGKRLKLTVGKSGQGYPGIPGNHLVEFVIHDQQQAPASISLNGRTLRNLKNKRRLERKKKGFYFDPEMQILFVRISFEAGKNPEITISG